MNSSNKRVMRKLVKPTHSRNVKADGNASGRKKTLVVAPIVVKEQRRASSIAPDGKKLAEMEKKLGEMEDQKMRQKERSDKLSNALTTTKSTLNYTQQERSRMQQFWKLAEINLEKEQRRGMDVEKTIFELKTRQSQHVHKLQQRIRCLALNAKTHRHVSTQSDEIPPGGELTCADTQTMEEMTREKATTILRQSDDLLMAFISELEKDKLSAQSDLKYALVQLEQRMKEEMETKIKRMREEHEIEIEDIGLKHIEQIRNIESVNGEEVAGMRGKIDFLQNEVSTLHDLRDALSQNLEDTREKLIEQAQELGEATARMESMSKELKKLEEYKRDFQRDIHNVESMRKEVEKYKELNSIIMGEFEKIEKDRDELWIEMRKNLDHLDVANQKRFENIGKRGKMLRESVGLL